MAGLREEYRESLPSGKFQESISGKKAPGTNYSYNALSGEYEWRKTPAIPGVNYMKGPDIWLTVRRLWDQLFGQKQKEYTGPDPEEARKAQGERQAKRDEIASIRSRLEAAGRDTSGFTDEELLKWNAAGAFKKYFE